MKKHCPKCNRHLVHSQFSKNQARKDGLQSWCKDCKAAKYRERLIHNRNNVYRRKRDLAVWLHDYKLGRSCKKCGEIHIACLQFHHRDPTQKEIHISRAISNGWSIGRLRKEIEKCDILCANCHAKEHYKP